MALKLDPARRLAMRFSLAFRRPDVDGLLGQITHEQYEEWQAFFLLEPAGWPAVQMAVKRIVWAIFRFSRNDNIDEFPFKTPADAMLTPAQQRVKEEIDAAKAEARLAAQA